MAIEYTDGAAEEARVRAILADSPNLGSGENPGATQYGEWSVRYHLCRERSNLVRPFHFQGLDVVEIGAGMGAVSRYLAENARSLHTIEGTEDRHRGIELRLQGLSNWTGEVAEFATCTPRRQYDVAIVIGVLEYAERFITPTELAHPIFLEQVKRFLKPDGVLILAIENALGLKYWGGAAEDHNGTLYDGMVGYSSRPGAKTFSRKRLSSLLQSSGFECAEFLYPFPDYKIPSCVLTERMLERAPEAAASLACHRPYENYTTPRVRSFPDSLATLTAAREGWLAEMSNSFLVMASTKADSSILETVRPPRDLLAWHFGNSETRFQEKPSGLTVTKGKTESPLVPGTPFRFELARAAYFEEWDRFQFLFTHYLRWAAARYRESNEALRAEALDAVFLNAIVEGEGFTNFDLEWDNAGPVPVHWFVFRNVFACIRDFETLSASAPFRTLHDLYTVLCHSIGVAPRFEEALEQEAQFQERVGGGSRNHHRAELRKLFGQVFPPLAFPRQPAVEAHLRSRLQGLEAENAAMKAFLNRRSVKMARRALNLIKRVTLRAYPKTLSSGGARQNVLDRGRTREVPQTCPLGTSRTPTAEDEGPGHFDRSE
ncbi:MAG: methyltransferase domain-containing protein [Deltaproteobacteria bacterium]|nr:methyltransferase domain-containing protein [Deltaproteobacteria bacterium]MBI3294207.1 methyltransferase domain-containing protein [Deltaproteobacteria bacterium]